MALEGTFYQLEQLGLFDVLLPFMLIFALVFAVLTKVKIFGEGSRQYNIVIALVMGLGVVFPHVLGYYPAERDVVVIINQALPNVSVVIVAIVMALIVIGLMGGRVNVGNSSLSGWLAIISFGLVIFIFGAAAQWWHLPDWLYMLRDPDTMALVVVVLVFAIIIWFITKEDKKEPWYQRFGKDVGNHIRPLSEDRK